MTSIKRDLLQSSLFLFQIGYSVVQQMFDDVYEIIERSFVEHKETFQDDNLRDFMDVFIKQMKSAEEVKTNWNILYIEVSKCHHIDLDQKKSH